MLRGKTNAATSETNASNSASAAAASETNAAASYDSFDDRYLGAKASAPTLDNDGDALLTGALYWNSTSDELYVWNGSAWEQGSFTAGGFLSNVVEDTTPQLGGDLDLNGNNITGTGNIDGRDVSADGTKLDGIEAGADVTDTANVTAAGALMDSELTDITAVKAINQGLSTTDTVLFEAIHEDYDALSGTTPTVDADNAGSFALTTSGNTTFTFSSVTSGITVGFVLKITAGGTHTITWPASVDWAGATAPDAPASGETDVLVFYTVDGGTTWYGALAIDAAA